VAFGEVPADTDVRRPSEHKPTEPDDSAWCEGVQEFAIGKQARVQYLHLEHVSAKRLLDVDDFGVRQRREALGDQRVLGPVGDEERGRASGLSLDLNDLLGSRAVSDQAVSAKLIQAEADEPGRCHR